MVSYPKYYRQILEKPFSFSITFLLTSYFLFTIFATVLFVLFDLPRIRSIVTQAESELQTHFPTDLEIHWDGQNLRSNNPQTLAIEFPSQLPKDSFPSSKLALLNTQVNETKQVADKAEASSLLFISSNTLYVSNSNSGWSELPLDQVIPNQPFTLNRQTLPSTIAYWKEVSNNLLQIAPFAYPVGFFLLTVPLRLVGLFVEAMVIFLLLRLINSQLSLGKIFQLLLHIGVIAELVQLVTASLTQTSLPMYSLTLWGYFLVILPSLRELKVLKRSPQ